MDRRRRRNLVWPTPRDPGSQPLSWNEKLFPKRRDYASSDASKDVASLIQNAFHALENVKSIDGDIKLTALLRAVKNPSTRYRRVSRAARGTTAFSYHQVEQLLAQMANLLERCYATRLEWQQQFDKALSTLLELYQFVEIYSLHDGQESEVNPGGSMSEIANGFYLLSSEDATTAQSSGQGQENYATATKGPTYVQNPGTGEPFGTAGTNFWAAHDYFAAAYADAKARNATTLETATAAGQQYSAAGAYFNNTILEQVLNSRQPYLDARVAYESTSVATRRARTQVARDAEVAKSVLFCQAHGAFDQLGRLDSLRSRFAADFENAICRFVTLKSGLSSIYNYQPPKYENGPGYKGPDPKTQPFDYVMQWVRDAAEWLIRFGQNEQSYVLSLSVRAIFDQQNGSGAWERQLQNAAPSWSFVVGREFFPSQCNVRVRGIGAYVVSSPDRLYNATIRLPRWGRVDYLGNTVPNLKLDQSDLPMARVGRIQPRSAPHDADVVGTVSLFNASPVSGYQDSPWTVTISDSQVPPGRSGVAAIGDLRDVVLDLHLSVIGEG